MFRAVVPIAVTILALACGPSAAAMPEGASAPEMQLAQVLPVDLQQRRVAVDKLAAVYDSANASFEANEAALDREAATLRQRQALLDLHKREYKEGLARCGDVKCVDGLNPQRDAINIDQRTLNRDIDTYNGRMAQREQEAARLDLMEAQIKEMREEIESLSKR
jgi:hypothetical protein